jgi:AAA family ATP:ADP antiporter
LILAHQVAGRAVRDGLFLSRFTAADLPKVVVASAVVSVLLGLGFARLLSKSGPLRVVPAAFAAGGLLHLMEFALLRTQGNGVRAVVIPLIYMHLVGFGAILVSGFWSVASEVFDPRQAKREFGRIAAAGTAGGVVGGILAERGAVWFGADSLLVLLAVLHLGACLVLRRVARENETSAALPEMGQPWQAAREAFRHAPFLVNLCVLVLIGSMSAALLDYLFKSGASAAYGRGPQLTRYFAIFYTASQALTFLVQNFLTPVSLRRLGLGRTMQWHSTAVAVGAGASLAHPGLAMFGAARSFEMILRGSFLRSSYELFFTPVPAREKRATKLFIDVSCDRMGDAAGAGVLQLLLILGPRQAVMPILLVTISLAVLSYWMTKRMDAAYSRVLEHGLLSRAMALNEAEVQDSTTLAALLHSTTVLPKRQPRPPAAAVVKERVHDPLLTRLAELRSGVPRRVCLALAADLPYDAAVVPLAIRLLGWDEAFDWARAFLLRYAHRAVGQLVDALLDPEQDVAVRRRIPHILAYTTSQRAVDGLTNALEDPRFEIRFNVSRALEYLHRMSDDLKFDHSLLLAAVERELSSSRSIREGRRLVEKRDQSDSQYWYLDEVLRDRADKSLEHIFSLLTVQFPGEPLKVAFRGLHSPDRLLRGLALEFLETRISVRHVSLLRRLVEPAGAAAAPRQAPPELDELAAFDYSVLSGLRNASAGAPSRDA